MAQFDAKKFKELQGSAGGQEKSKKQEKAKPAKKEQPKKEKPAPAPEAEEEPAAPKPPKDPYALLPAGTFVMDEWKRTFSNNDVAKVALPWFYENFDPECYSVWYCEYKYPEELSLVFMTANLIGGMYQRLDRLRKHAFGSMIIFGEDRNSTISGVWIWRGQDLAFELSEDCQVDYESYSWKKIDHTSEENSSMNILIKKETLEGKSTTRARFSNKLLAHLN